jgi:hypothetical protein
MVTSKFFVLGNVDPIASASMRPRAVVFVAPRWKVLDRQTAT